MLQRIISVLAFGGLLLLSSACSKGGEGESCFDDGHCRGSLICCNASGSTRGSCEKECEDVPPTMDAGSDAGDDDAGSDAGDDDAGSDAGEDDAATDGGEDAGDDAAADDGAV